MGSKKISNKRRRRQERKRRHWNSNNTEVEKFNNEQPNAPLTVGQTYRNDWSKTQGTYCLIRKFVKDKREEAISTL